MPIATRVAGKSVVVVVTILAAAGALWVRQDSEALLRVASPGGAVAQVAVWGAPAFALYALVVWSRAGMIAMGAALVLIVTATWWWSATDASSTASLGPALVCWIAVPLLVIGTGLVEALVRWGGRREGGAGAGASPRR